MKEEQFVVVLRFSVKEKVEGLFYFLFYFSIFLIFVCCELILPLFLFNCNIYLFAQTLRNEKREYN